MVLLDTTLSARTLLDRALAIEDAYGRERSTDVRNAPRTLDVDLIVVGDRRANDEDLVLPHPGARAGIRARALARRRPGRRDPRAGPVADLLEKRDRSALDQARRPGAPGAVTRWSRVSTLPG